MADNNNNNNNWSFGVNLAGVRAATGLNTTVPEGFYKGICTDVYVSADKPGRVVFKLTISEGDCVGSTRTTGLNMPKSATDNVRYYWRAAMEAAGYTPAQLDSGELELSRSMFVDRQMLFFFRPGDKEAGIYEELNFIPPAEWAQRAASFVPSAPAAAEPRRTRSEGAGTGFGFNAGTNSPGLSEALSNALNGSSAPSDTTASTAKVETLVSPPPAAAAGAQAATLLSALGI